MNIFEKLADLYEAQHMGTATNLTAVKVNVEQAREALKQLNALADEMAEASGDPNGNSRRCWQCVREGLEGESQDALLEIVDQWKSEQRHLGNRIRTQTKIISDRLEYLVETDQSLANMFSNM